MRYFHLKSADCMICIHHLLLFVDTIGPADVGLKEVNREDDRGHGMLGLNLFNRVDRWVQPITYVDIHEGDTFTVRFISYSQLLTVHLK